MDLGGGEGWGIEAEQEGMEDQQMPNIYENKEIW